VSRRRAIVVKVCRRDARSCAENWCSASVERMGFLRGVKPLTSRRSLIGQGYLCFLYGGSLVRRGSVFHWLYDRCR
jgi:hypothetical protein